MPEQPYPILRSHVDRKADDFQRNHAAGLAAVAKLTAALRDATAGGGDKYNSRHVAAGKLLPRQRVELLLDRDSYFLELCPLAGKDVPGHAAGASVIGGVGVVSGVECLITASEATVKGGAMSEVSVWKSGRLSDIAEQNRLPSISLIESAGADLPNQSKIFVPGGRGFRDLTRRSEAGVPTICLVFGSSTAGGAYIPGMSDYVVMVKEQAQVYLAGPPLVKMATGEESSHEELGGAEMHARISGVADYLAADELDALRLGREIVAHLDWRKAATPTPRPIEPPRYDADELLGIVPADPKVPYDAREVIARIVDGSRWSEFKPLFGSTLVCGWAHVHGFPVGILANNGILFSESSQKGAQFIQLCNQRNIPLLFLQNITGFMVGKKYEQEGIIKHGAKLINAVSNSTVPAITIMTGASFGAGNYAMSGRAYAPRFLFTWPSHRIAVMGGKQLAGVLDIIQREAAAKRGEAVDEQKLGFMKAMIEKQIDNESDPYFATARLWDDGIIDPRDTRTVVAIALSASYSAPVAGTTSWGVFRH
ncbi:MAG: acyl-CoA carboxylase subunit beta [Kofleriaceae bacterium]|jgi:acetyl-CoA carboxylase carboxyltransferase component|nr:acyl-CoA carboxylase subunit beta [Kofleriaceae bacterium]MBP9167954.1 acyl-CoA carboxylase subunit beta [Kofleriaceae bacterium]MBP9856788.1 acyl-CoA carboxylase subunit beta [Kofleriaceae bacterium]